MLRQTLCRN